MARKSAPTSAINAYLFLCLCVAAPFLSTGLCRLVSAILIVRFLMFAIQAAVTSGARRTFALGFLISALAYLGCVWQLRELEAAKSSHLPTTRMLNAIVLTTPQQKVSSINPDEARWPTGVRENHAAFMSLGQLLFSCLFGAVGGLYARQLTKGSLPGTSV